MKKIKKYIHIADNATCSEPHVNANEKHPGDSRDFYKVARQQPLLLHGLATGKKPLVKINKKSYKTLLPASP